MQRREQGEEERGGGEAHRFGEPEGERVRGLALGCLRQEKSGERSANDGEQGSESKKDNQGGGEGEGHAGRVRGEALAHGEDRLGDDGDGDELESVDDAKAEPSGEKLVAEGEGKHEERRGHGEGGPRGESAGPSGAKQAEGEADLAAGGSGHGLSDGDDLGKGLFTAPAAALDELGVEVAEVGDGPSEGEQAEAQEGAEDLGGVAVGGRRAE